MEDLADEYWPAVLFESITHMTVEPASRRRFVVTAGVPMETGTVYTRVEVNSSSASEERAAKFGCELGLVRTSDDSDALTEQR